MSKDPTHRIPVDEVVVRDNPESRSYDAFVAGQIAARIVYETAGSNRRVFTHTFVEPSLRGRGIGAALVHAALDDIRHRGFTLTNFCDFVAGYIRSHPDYADLIDPAHPGLRTTSHDRTTG